MNVKTLNFITAQLQCKTEKPNVNKLISLPVSTFRGIENGAQDFFFWSAAADRDTTTSVMLYSSSSSEAEVVILANMATSDQSAVVSAAQVYRPMLIYSKRLRVSYPSIQMDIVTFYDCWC